MLPERLLDVEFHDDRVIPRYLTSRDLPWIEELLFRLSACEDLSRTEVDARLCKAAPNFVRFKAWRALGYLLLKASRFEVRASLAPAAIRQTVFEKSGSLTLKHPREKVLAECAQTLGLSPQEIERDLYADLSPEHRLKPYLNELSSSEWLERYNLSLAQGLLQRAETLHVFLEGNIKGVLRFARLQRLLCIVEKLSASEAKPHVLAPFVAQYCFHLSGPLALFHHTLKYGRSMALWLPTLVRAPLWALQATCILKHRKWHWQASFQDPIGTSHLPFRRYDSALEEKFAKDLCRWAPDWEVLREADPVQIGSRILCPDFTLLHPSRGLRIPVEIVGYWTPAYLSSKIEIIRNLPKMQPWLICIDETLASASKADLPADTCFVFRRRIDVKAFLLFVERWLKRSNSA